MLFEISRTKFYRPLIWSGQSSLQGKTWTKFSTLEGVVCMTCAYHAVFANLA
jgi:hypothetical protein